MTRDRRLIGLLVALALLPTYVASADSVAASAAPERPIRWLAIGDSFSSGEGILFTEDPCHRAEGAYAPRAAAQLAADGFPVDEEAFRFVACTGNITDDFSQPASDNREVSQLTEARTSTQGLGVQGSTSDAPYDLVTLTFGGNNIGFDDVLKDCVGIDTGWIVISPRWFECEISAEELFDRIEALRGPGDTLYEGEVSLPTLYDQIAEVVRPGGHLLVLGYPHPLEDPSDWWSGEMLRCNRIKRLDAQLLRSAGDLLNVTIEAAVAEADRRHPDVTFTFLDVRELFEGHALCSGFLGEEWIVRIGQALMHPKRIERTFHPNQLGHAAMADLLVEQVQQLDWTGITQGASTGVPPTHLEWRRIPHDETVFGSAGSVWQEPYDFFLQIYAVVSGGPGLVAVGVDAEPAGPSVAAVWTSADGVSWSRVPHSEALVPRGYSSTEGSAGMRAVTVGGPGLVAVGEGVWVSPDGVSWTQSSVPGDCQELRSVTAGGLGLVAVGHVYPSPPLDDEGCGSAVAAVWTSPDGLTWTRVPHEDSVFGRSSGPRYPYSFTSMSAVTAGGPGFVATGLECPPTVQFECDAAVWTSPDGLSWSRVPHSEAVFGGADIRSVTAGGPGLVAVGSDCRPASGCVAAVWTSPDGLLWSRVPYDESVFGSAPNESHAEMRALTVWESNLVAVGSDVWTSSDGLSWSRVSHDEAVFGLISEPELVGISSVTAGGPGLVAVGSEWLDGVGPRAAVWVAAPVTSADDEAP